MIVNEDIVVPEDCVLLPRLKNSETLQKLDALFSHLTEVQNKDLTQLLMEFPGLFSDVPTRTHLMQHDVDVGDAQPIRQRFYRAPVSKRKALESEIQYMLENGIAVPSCSSWASPCLLVRKLDSIYRFCTDYRKLNAITKPDAFPLPRVKDCVDQVGTAKFVTKIDLLKGYWQVPLTPRAREVTSFITSSGLYSYSVMSFGLRNAPATFQRLMNRVVFGLEGCAVYLDDVIVFSGTWEQYLVCLRALLTRLAEACLTVNLAKCEFAKATVSYLGKVVGQGKVRPVQAKVLAIQQFPSPSTKKELMHFLGMVGYYRGFCSNFSTVVSPLTDLLKSSVKFDWSENCQRAFENVKLLLMTAPVLAAPRLDMPFKLQVDASQVGAGAVLLQTGEDGLDYPSPSQRLMRWILFLQPYNLIVKHIKGSDNVVADALIQIAGGEVGRMERIVKIMWYWDQRLCTDVYRWDWLTGAGTHLNPIIVLCKDWNRNVEVQSLAGFWVVVSSGLLEATGERTGCEEFGRSPPPLGPSSLRGLSLLVVLQTVSGFWAKYAAVVAD
ncbi:Retrovirus-related Pol polyprotein [Labeo rohita]|uniref:ribonuclease H n=1 Tax=Labeo rohita TaxID=84645 RepID=A0ABQ8L505_LABRO|nr:Retrovirus-related Pol polyprotein [Labeo rohita]